MPNRERRECPSQVGLPAVARLRLSITVAKYGGVLDAQVIEGDAIFRKAVYDSLGSMRFEQTFFMGEPARIQALVEFTQHDSGR